MQGTIESVEDQGSVVILFVKDRESGFSIPICWDWRMFSDFVEDQGDRDVIGLEVEFDEDTKELRVVEGQ